MQAVQAHSRSTYKCKTRKLIPSFPFSSRFDRELPLSENQKFRLHTRGCSLNRFLVELRGFIPSASAQTNYWTDSITLYTYSTTFLTDAREVANTAQPMALNVSALLHFKRKPHSLSNIFSNLQRHNFDTEIKRFHDTERGFYSWSTQTRANTFSYGFKADGSVGR